MKFDAHGRELPDSTPIEIPAGMRRPESVQEMMARMVRTSISQMAVSQGKESFDEAFDFDVDDDAELPLTSHELVAMKLEIGKDGEGRDPDEDSGDGDERGVGKRGREADRADRDEPDDSEETRRGYRNRKGDDRSRTSDRSSRNRRADPETEDSADGGD